MYFAPPELVVVLVLNFQGVVQLQNHGPCTDVQHSSFTVVIVAAYVGVFDVVVSIIAVNEDGKNKK